MSLIEVNCDVSKASAALGRIMAKIGPAGRHELYSAAAASVGNLVKRHVSRESLRRHFSARRLGAQPTGHLEKGARAVTFFASPASGEVIIPIPGISRAFQDLEIIPNHAKALTIPMNAHSYGRRVAELRALGWNFFKMGKESSGILFGRREEEVVPMYVLKTRVRQAQDRSLLPSDADVARSAASAMRQVISSLKH